MNDTQRTGFLIGKFFAPLFLTVFGVAKLLLRPTLKVAVAMAVLGILIAGGLETLRFIVAMIFFGALISAVKFVWEIS